MRIAIFLLIAVALFGGESLFAPYDLRIDAIVHGEYEAVAGKENNDSFPEESNAYGSIYAKVTAHYDIDDRLYLSLGGKANYVLSEENYDTPFYLGSKLTSDKLDRAILSEASVTYDDGFYSLSVGRNDIDYDWLLGSMDGIVGVVGDDQSASLRLFWFRNFVQLHYNYYFELNDINEDKGIFGAIAKMDIADFEVSAFDYFMQELRNIAGLHVSYFYDALAFNIGYNEAKALAAALYDYDESFLQFSVEMLFGSHFVEFGGSMTGENGLLAMIQLGSFMYGQFYLGNQVDREEALNGYLRYIYAERKYYFECIGGYTAYTNTFLTVADNLDSYEFDAYVGYKIDTDWSLNFGIMAMYVDEDDPIAFDQYLATVNIRYKYELF